VPACGAVDGPGRWLAGRLPAGQRCDGESCAAVFRGFLAFFDREPARLRGNGRSCADCHMPSERFQLSPESAERRYQRLQQRRNRNRYADDPLFRAIDADDFRIHGALAADFGNLRQNGLVRVPFALPSNMRLIDPATNAISHETVVDVWRTVPSVNNVALTGPDEANPWPRGPNPSGGYQLDARFTTLQEQASSALRVHAETRGVIPSRLLHDLAAFQRFMFSSERARSISNDLNIGTPSVGGHEPHLTALEQQGRVVFVRSCAQCHGGAGQSTTQAPVVRYHDISAQCPRPVDTLLPARFKFRPCAERLARNSRTYEITLPTGIVIRRITSDPGRALLTGFAALGPPAADDWNKFDVPGLNGIGHTAPYFHNNSADTLEEVLDHYIEFFKRVRAIAPPGVVLPVLSTDGSNFDRALLPDERAALLAYLRKL
jgi:cytochrome c peroxidase